MPLGFSSKDQNSKKLLKPKQILYYIFIQIVRESNLISTKTIKNRYQKSNLFSKCD